MYVCSLLSEWCMYVMHVCMYVCMHVCDGASIECGWGRKGWMEWGFSQTTAATWMGCVIPSNAMQWLAVRQLGLLWWWWWWWWWLWLWRWRWCGWCSSFPPFLPSFHDLAADGHGHGLGHEDDDDDYGTGGPSPLYQSLLPFISGFTSLPPPPFLPSIKAWILRSKKHSPEILVLIMSLQKIEKEIHTTWIGKYRMPMIFCKLPLFFEGGVAVGFSKGVP